MRINRYFGGKSQAALQAGAQYDPWGGNRPATGALANDPATHPRASTEPYCNHDPAACQPVDAVLCECGSLLSQGHKYRRAEAIPTRRPAGDDL